MGANVNGAGKIFVFRKQPDGDASAWSCVGSRKALPQPITTLAMAPGGKTLGFGCSEGGVAALSSGALSLLNRLPYAHMVFVTALAFSPSGKVLASVSADASARCTAVTLRTRTARQAFLRFLFLVCATLPPPLPPNSSHPFTSAPILLIRSMSFFPRF